MDLNLFPSLKGAADLVSVLGFLYQETIRRDFSAHLKGFK